MKLQELFADRSRWTQRAYARNHAGSAVAPNDPEATCWCLLGGIQKCYGPKDRGYIIAIISRKLDDTISTFNDFEGYDKVLQLCKDLNI